MSTLSNMDLTNELYLNRNDWYSSHMNNFPGSPAHSQKHFANLPESRIHGPASYGQFGLSTPMSQKPSAPFYSSETSGLKKCSDFFHSKASSPYSFNSTGPGVSHSYGSSSPLLIDQNSSVSSTLPNRTSAFSKFNLGFHSSMPFPNASMNSLTNPSDFSSRFHEASTAAIKQSSNCALASMSNSRVAPTSLNPMNSFYDRVSEYNSFTKPSYSLFKPSLPPCNFSGSLSSGSSSEGSSSGSPPQLYNPHNLHQIDPQLTIDLNQSTSGLGDEADDSAYSIKNEDGDETQSLQDAQYEWMRRSQHAFASQPGKTRTKDKYRTVYTEHQKFELEKEFHSNTYIMGRRKAELAVTLGLTERQIKIWFQNRRAKGRKQARPFGVGRPSDNCFPQHLSCT